MFEFDTGWLSEISKRKVSENREMARIKALFDKFETTILTATHASLKKLRLLIDVEKLERLIAQGRFDEALRQISKPDVARAFRQLSSEVTFSMTYAARDAVSAQSEEAGRVTQFNATAPRFSATIEDYEADIEDGFSETALDAAYFVIEDGRKYERPAGDMARDIALLIVLTTAQATAALNYRAALQNDKRDALSRALRDERFDAEVARSINDNTRLSPARIEAMTERYVERVVDHRAKTIAQTEVQRAVNGGTFEAWVQMVETWAVQGPVLKFWNHMHDDKVRAAHLTIPTLNKAGVDLMKPFQTPDGPMLYPGDPAAPPRATINCRCSLAYRTAQNELSQAA